MNRKLQVPVAKASTLNLLSMQLLLGFSLAVLLPACLRYVRIDDALGASGFASSFIGATIGVVLGVLMLRRVTAFPGTRTFEYILPSFAGAFGAVLTVLFALRLEYSRLYFGSCFLAAVTVFFVLSIYLQPRTKRRFYAVPGFMSEDLHHPFHIDWIEMQEPVVPLDADAVIVADFRRDHSPEWERMMAEAAVQGHTVFHSKQLIESLTGRVSIEHLSENNFGSLLPNLAWRKAKRSVDLVSALALLPVLLPLFLLIAAWIKLDSPGPALFRQMRMGAGGRPFRIIKFRTMIQARHQGEADVRAAVTHLGDDRVTRAGRFLRRSRIDELPQIFNVIAGQMSWIGPRPEAIALSRWYDAEIPFYIYRHIVRPGITGWAQVNQGHVSELLAVDRKLQYDFYYIKNFSVWIDILIALKTLRIMLTGFGAR